MSDSPENPNQQNGADATQGGPSLVVLAQYLKDLSFESPKAPEAFKIPATPEIDVNVDVNGRGLGPDQYEVEFSVSAKASHQEEPIFVVEASYGGVFEIKNLAPDQLEIAMLVECPRLLFPFLRQIVADATRNGNFPPLMLDPIDFMGIYIANKQNMQQQQPAAGDPHLAN